MSSENPIGFRVDVYISSGFNRAPSPLLNLGGHSIPSWKKPTTFPPSGPFRSFQATDKTMLLIRAVHRDMAPKPWMITKKIRILAPLCNKTPGSLFGNSLLKGSLGDIPKLKGISGISQKNGGFFVDVWEVFQNVCFFFLGGGGNLWQEKNRSIFGPVMDK